MSQNLADGLRADRAPGTVGAARRRRDRRLRAFLRHERLAVAMSMATIHHHSFMKSAVVDVSVHVGSPSDYVAPAPAVTLPVHSQQLRPAYTSASVAAGVNFDVTGFVNPQFSRTAVEGSASQVVDPLPPIEEFTGPVYNLLHQKQFAAGEMPENLVEIPVVQEQVIVQAIPEVVDPLPLVHQFTGPGFNQVHHERFAAGETTENLVDFPVVQEQVVVQALPEVVDSLPPVEEFTGLGFNRVHHELLAAVPSTTEFFPMSDEESGELPAGVRPAPVDEGRPQAKVQRRTVEQLVAAMPGLPALDAPVPLVKEQLVDVLSLKAKYDLEMDKLEDRILQGFPVSAAEKEAWRRWASRGGEFSLRKKKKRKKKKLPRGYSQCKTVQKTGRLHRSKGVVDVHAVTSSSSSSFWVPCSQFIDRVWTSRCAQRRVPSVQTAQQTGDILQVRLLDQVVSMSVVAVQTVQPVEIPQLQFLDKFDMPVVALTVVLVGTCRKLWRYRSCRFSSRNGCPSLCNDRCWLVDPDCASVLFLDKVVLPVVMQDRFPGLDVQKTVGFPQLQFLTVVVAMPVELPQAQFLDKVMSIVVSGADGQTVQKTVEYPQLQFQDKALTMSSRSLVGVKMQVKVGIGSCAILGDNIETSWVTFAGVWRCEC